MKLIKKERCSVFEITIDNSVVKIFNKNLIIDNFKVDGSFLGFNIYGDYVFTYNNEIDETIVIKISNREIVFSSKSFIGIRNDLDFRFYKRNLFGQFEEDLKEGWCFINKENFFIEETVEFCIENRYLNLISDDSFIFKNVDSFGLKKLSTNEPIWHYSFNQLLEGKEIEQVGDVLIYNSLLFISLRDNQEVSTKATFVLNVNSGEIIRKYHSFSGQLIRDIDYLYVASRYNVERACLNTHEIVSYDLEEVLKPLGFQIHWSSYIVKNDRLYFVDGGWAKTNRIGIIDLESRKLVWHYDFRIGEVVNMNIVKVELNENNLYVQCSDDTLHIFEKE